MRPRRSAPSPTTETEFEDDTCEELAARFAAGGSAFVEIEDLEDEAGGSPPARSSPRTKATPRAS